MANKLLCVFLLSMLLGACVPETVPAAKKNCYPEAAKEFLRWNKAGGREAPGLIRRRQEERNMFMEGCNE